MVKMGKLFSSTKKRGLQYKCKLSAGFTPTPFITKLPKATHSVHRYERCRGFTVIELLVVLGIILLFTGVALFNQSTARGIFEIDAATQEIILNIREAQVYGVSALETSLGAGGFDYAYGIRFPGGPEQLVFFVDLNDNGLWENPESIRSIEVKSGYEITSRCSQIATVVCGAADVTFKRPNPSAVIIITQIPSGPATVEEDVVLTVIQSSDPSNTRDIIIEESGQIYIQ